jgi:hypothetical protein
MGSRAITLEFYEQLLEAFREKPGLCTAVARKVGCHRATAKKAWECGFPLAREGCRRAIRDVIYEEQERIRARQLEEQKAASELTAKRLAELAEKAKQDATTSRAEELKVARLARATAMQTLSAIATINAGVIRVGAEVQKGLDALVTRAKEINPKTNLPNGLALGELDRLIKLLGTVAGANRSANDAAMRAVEIERLIAGEPSRVLGVHVSQTVTIGQARELGEKLLRGVSRLERQGIVIDADIPALPPGDKGR